MIVDLQVNLETKSGALAEPEALVAGAKSAGLDGLLVTREGALNPELGALREAGKVQGIAVFGGVKIATNHGVILCIRPNPDEALPDTFAEKVDGVYDANSVIDAIDAEGGVTVALRPYDRDLPRPMGDHLFSLQGLAACEVQNGRLSEIANDLALEAASNMEMPCVGTSCADGAEGLGTSATLFRTRMATEAELCEAIRKGDCWPVSFSDVLPAQDSHSERSGPSRGGGDSGRRRGRRGGRNRRDGHVGGGGDRGGEGMRGRGAPNGERRRGGRRRRGGQDRDRPGGGGRGRAGGAPMRGQNRPDDFGNRIAQGRGAGGARDDDFGNVISPEERALPSEDIGNRLRPGEMSPYAPVAPHRRQHDHERDHDHDDGGGDDNSGNR